LDVPRSRPRAPRRLLRWLLGRRDRAGRRLRALRGAGLGPPAGRGRHPGRAPLDAAALGRPRRGGVVPARLGLRPLRPGGLTPFVFLPRKAFPIRSRKESVPSALPNGAVWTYTMV